MDQVHSLLLMLAAVVEYFATRLWELLKMAAFGGSITTGIAFFLWLLRTFAAPGHP